MGMQNGMGPPRNMPISGGAFPPSNSNNFDIPSQGSFMPYGEMPLGNYQQKSPQRAGGMMRISQFQRGEGPPMIYPTNYQPNRQNEPSQQNKMIMPFPQDDLGGFPSMMPFPQMYGGALPPNGGHSWEDDDSSQFHGGSYSPPTNNNSQNYRRRDSLSAEMASAALIRAQQAAHANEMPRTANSTAEAELQPLMVLKGKVQHQHPKTNMWLVRRLKLQDGVLLYFDDRGKTVLSKLRFWETIIRTRPDPEDDSGFYLLFDNLAKQQAEMRFRVDSRATRDAWIEHLEYHYQRCALLMARLHVDDTPDSSNTWFYNDRQSQQRGPFTLEQMLTWNEHRQLPSDLQVWFKGGNPTSLKAGNILRDTAVKIRVAVREMGGLELKGNKERKQEATQRMMLKIQQQHQPRGNSAYRNGISPMPIPGAFPNHMAGNGGDPNMQGGGQMVYDGGMAGMNNDNFNAPYGYMGGSMNVAGMPMPPQMMGFPPNTNFDSMGMPLNHYPSPMRNQFM